MAARARLSGRNGCPAPGRGGAGPSGRDGPRSGLRDRGGGARAGGARGGAPPHRARAAAALCGPGARQCPAQRDRPRGDGGRCRRSARRPAGAELRSCDDEPPLLRPRGRHKGGRCRARACPWPAHPDRGLGSPRRTAPAAGGLACGDPPGRGAPRAAGGAAGDDAPGGPASGDPARGEAGAQSPAAGPQGGRAPFRLLAPLVLHAAPRHAQDGEDLTPQAHALFRDAAALDWDQAVPRASPGKRLPSAAGPLPARDRSPHL
ncbi:hypothetical protein ruthe_02405 [Rubellimicrobium thermophilum DSM 16684]|uniref:Uncharacterized protein n=1 Tax=Rubellimicrobium thermophilum DSM 16684 TaxID=1123069 RepID=S9SD95_9RHOB|nr:hypothetical protein ruthe_02405 [Rubellimicrobium thermophilum DSM 16684]